VFLGVFNNFFLDLCCSKFVTSVTVQIVPIIDGVWCFEKAVLTQILLVYVNVVDERECHFILALSFRG
jgi:hypothetical protein